MGDKKKEINFKVNFPKGEPNKMNHLRYFSFKIKVGRDIEFKKRLYQMNYIIIILIIILTPYIDCNQRKINLNNNYIIIKINKTGLSNIFGSANYINEPLKVKEIIINNISQNDIKRIYDLNTNENEIKLIWDIKLTTTSSMFDTCKYIIEIDLSNFDASEVTEMNNMFCSCSSLTSINLSNMETSKVSNMLATFEGCQSLSYYIYQI